MTARLVDAGLTEAEALRAATLGPAEFLETTDSLGQQNRRIDGTQRLKSWKNMQASSR